MRHPTFLFPYVVRSAPDRFWKHFSGLVKEEETLNYPRLVFVGYSESGPAFGTTRGKYFSSVLGGHPCAESVFIFSLSVRGLKCTFHTIFYLLLSTLFTGCKISQKK